MPLNYYHSNICVTKFCIGNKLNIEIDMKPTHQSM